MSRRRSGLDEPNVELYFGRASSDKHQRKDAQLCRQVMEALSVALAGLVDESLSGVWVAEVVPAPNTGRLRVVLEAPPDADVEAIERAIEGRAKSLRWEVANAIHRKKAPSLRFVVVPVNRGGEVGR